MEMAFKLRVRPTIYSSLLFGALLAFIIGYGISFLSSRQSTTDLVIDIVKEQFEFKDRDFIKNPIIQKSHLVSSSHLFESGNTESSLKNPEEYKYQVNMQKTDTRKDHLAIDFTYPDSYLGSGTEYFHIVFVNVFQIISSKALPELELYDRLLMPLEVSCESDNIIPEVEIGLSVYPKDKPNTPKILHYWVLNKDIENKDEIDLMEFPFDQFRLYWYFQPQLPVLPKKETAPYFELDKRGTIHEMTLRLNFRRLDESIPLPASINGLLKFGNPVFSTSKGNLFITAQHFLYGFILLGLYLLFLAFFYFVWNHRYVLNQYNDLRMQYLTALSMKDKAERQLLELHDIYINFRVSNNLPSIEHQDKLAHLQLPFQKRYKLYQQGKAVVDIGYQDIFSEHISQIDRNSNIILLQLDVEEVTLPKFLVSLYYYDRELDQQVSNFFVETKWLLLIAFLVTTPNGFVSFRDELNNSDSRHIIKCGDLGIFCQKNHMVTLNHSDVKLIKKQYGKALISVKSGWIDNRHHIAYQLNEGFQFKLFIHDTEKTKFGNPFEIDRPSFILDQLPERK